MLSKIIGIGYAPTTKQKDTLLSILAHKSPERDGYVNYAFKKCYHIIGKDITKATLDFWSGVIN